MTPMLPINNFVQQQHWRLGHPWAQPLHYHPSHDQPAQRVSCSEPCMLRAVAQAYSCVPVSVGHANVCYTCSWCDVSLLSSAMWGIVG